mmetsp:Transcript_61451/g.168761  ORF Transcript_61451/g.168761 Transcript_61451/m.168761 type:complete len:103 (-) Transcript_61451:500-808(-)
MLHHRQQRSDKMAAPSELEGYKPTSVQEAWDNHFEAFGSQNLDKIMLDYDEKSVLRCFCHSDGADDTFKGVEEIRGFFDGLFKMLTDLRSEVQAGSIPRAYC